jgi:hypothetical protein
MNFSRQFAARLTIEAKSRLAAGAAKVKAVVEFVTKLLREGNKVLLTAHHHHVHDALAAAFGRRLVRCTGSETVQARDASLRAFSEGRAEIFLLANRMGDGLDGLQKTATCVVVAELDWSPPLHAQIEDRVWRDGFAGVNEIPCYYLISPAHYDGVMMQILGLKAGQFSGLVGGGAEVVTEETNSTHVDRLIKALQEDRTP